MSRIFSKESDGIVKKEFVPPVLGKKSAPFVWFLFSGRVVYCPFPVAFSINGLSSIFRLFLVLAI